MDERGPRLLDVTIDTDGRQRHHHVMGRGETTELGVTGAVSSTGNVAHVRNGAANMSTERSRNARHRAALTVFVVSALCIASTARARQFDRRDISGAWWVDVPGPDKLMERGELGDANKCITCHISEHTVPEPPLTPWASEHLAMQPKMQGGSAAAASDGCDPIGVPAQFWYTQLYPFEFVLTSSRIFQFFEKQNEWRVIWLNRGHPKHVRPTNMGDSVGRWEGDVLVVDTIGFNGQGAIEPVGVTHRMSPAFHVIERWQRVSASELQLDLTYYDKMAWGGKSWDGLRKIFILQPKMELYQTPCSPEDNRKFDERFAPPAPH